MKSPLKWHGGDHYSAKKIRSFQPPHKTYVETHAGGLSVLLESDGVGVSEIANDLNGHLTNFWRVLRSMKEFEEFEFICHNTPFSEEFWKEWEEIKDDVVRSGPNPRLAAAYFAHIRMSMGGRGEDFAPISRGRLRRKMNEQVSAWLSAVERLPEVHARLIKVLIMNRDAIDCIQATDSKETWFYIDPPFHPDTRVTPDVYEFEMTHEQHEALLGRLASVEGKFTLSGYRCPLYDDYAKQCGWRRVDMEGPNHASKSKKKRQMTDSLWMNY